MSSRAVVLIARHKLLLLLPFLVAVPAAIVYALLSGSDTYQSVGRVWVERPSFLRSAIGNSWNSYLSPAQNQADLVNQRLKTDDFAQRVAMVASATAARPVIADEVKRGAWAAADGSNLVKVGFNGPEPKAAQAIAAAVIAEYAKVEREQTLADANQAKLFYEGEITTAEAEYNSAREALGAYLVTCPTCPNVPDQTYIELREEADFARDVYQQALGDLRAARQFIEQTETTQSKTFQAQDAPFEPLAPLGRGMMALVGPPAVALLMAIAVSAAAFGVIYATDKTLYTAEDTMLIPNLRLLGTVPELPRQTQELAATDFGGTRRGRGAFIRGRD